MRSIILYSQETADFHHQAIKLPDGKQLFIRAEVVWGDPVSALDEASPRDGEVVLNSIPYPSENQLPELHLRTTYFGTDDHSGVTCSLTDGGKSNTRDSLRDYKVGNMSAFVQKQDKLSFFQRLLCRLFCPRWKEDKPVENLPGPWIAVAMLQTHRGDFERNWRLVGDLSNAYEVARWLALELADASHPELGIQWSVRRPEPDELPELGNLTKD